MEMVNFKDVVHTIPVLKTILKQDLLESEEVDYEVLFNAFVSCTKDIPYSGINHADLYHNILMEYCVNV